MEKIEYRVRPVTRFIVTRYHENVPSEGCAGVETCGQFDNYETAYAVGYALCKAEHERLHWPIGDERIRYPRRDEYASEPSVEASKTSGAVIGRIHPPPAG